MTKAPPPPPGRRGASKSTERSFPRRCRGEGQGGEGQGGGGQGGEGQGVAERQNSLRAVEDLALPGGVAGKSSHLRIPWTSIYGFCY
jgi:hypothetical protein